MINFIFLRHCALWIVVLDHQFDSVKHSRSDVSECVCLSVTQSALADLTDVTLVRDDTFRRL